MAVPGTPELKSALKKPDVDVPKYFVVRALDKFAGKAKDEISFEKKDLILVLEENTVEGKYRGEVIRSGKVKNEKTGWFPSFYARKDPNEKLPELPPSLQPKVEMTVPTVETSRKNTNSGSDVAGSKSSSPGGSLRGSSGTDGGEDKPTLMEMRKRFGGSRSTTIRTLKLMNDEAAEAEEDEPDTPDTPEPDVEDPKDKGQYMQGVASKMVSKLAFMQSKKKSSKNTPSAADSGKKSGIFSSLRKGKDSRSSSIGSEDSSSKKKNSSAPGSAGGTEKDKQAKALLPSAAAISERLSKANADAAAHEEGVPSINEPTPTPSPRGTNEGLRQSKELRASKSTGDLGEPKSVAFDANTPNNKGSMRSRKGSRAVIVEEDDATPAPQSAAVQQFNPEGKNIEIIAEIGKGATGCVWKGCIDGEFVALKQISLMNVKNVKNMRQALKDEVETMKGFNHPNILKYYAMFYSRVNQEINIVLELVEGISAAKLVAKQKPISEPLAAQVTYQLLDALKFLVRNNIVHRDVKPQNMLINTDGIIKLIDFGTVARLSASATHRNSTVGTPWYVAPEVINGDDYGYTADVWSVGCTLLEFVTGKPPYHDQNSVAALFKMVEEPHPPVPTNLTKECIDFLNACFKRDHKTRVMAHTCQDTPFIQARASQAELARVVGTIHVVPKDDGGFDL